MKRLGQMDKVVVGLAAVLIIFGICSVIHPIDGYLYAGHGRYSAGQYFPPEHVTQNRARIYGVILVGFGAGLAWLALYRPRK